MKKNFIFLSLFLFLGYFYSFAQSDFKVEKSGVVLTKKTDNAGFALQKPDGGVYVLVYNYKREIQYVNEFKSDMKLRKSTKIRAINDRIVSAALINGKIRVFAVEVGRGLGRVLEVDFNKKKFVEVGEPAYELNLKKISKRKKIAKADKEFNEVNEKMGFADIDASLYTFKSDKENFTLFSTLHNYNKLGTTIFSGDRPRPSTTHTIIKLDKDLKVVGNKEITLTSKGFTNFNIYDIDYFEDSDTYIFYAKGRKEKNKKRSKEQRKLDNSGFETIFIVKGDQKPVMFQLQDYDDLLATSKAKIIDSILHVASISCTRAYEENEEIDMGMVINSFSLNTLEKVGESIKTKISNSNWRPYVAGDSDGDNINAYEFRTLEKSKDNWVIAYHLYRVSPLYKTFGIGAKKHTELISSKRERADLEILVINSETGDIFKEYKVERELTYKKYKEGRYDEDLRKRLRIVTSGRYEYWNHGVFSDYKNDQFNFIVVAKEIKTDVNTGTITYVNTKNRDDLEFIKSKPYLITLDLEKGFEYKPLLKTGTSLNGLMVDKMVKISENEFITNTPMRKEKRYVKVTLD